MNETTNLKLKKPAGNEYISVGIINENMDIIDAGMKEISDSVDAPEFDASGSVDGITGKTTLLASFVSKMPLIKFMRNVKAGFKLVSFVGDIVNNCVTDNANLPLSAAQGKKLMDLYTVLNTKIIKAPDYKNYKSVSLPFTAPDDGYICGGIYSLGTTACHIYVNNTRVGWNHSGGGSNTASPFMYPLSKGDIVTANGYDQFQAYFIYTK